MTDSERCNTLRLDKVGISEVESTLFIKRTPVSIITIIIPNPHTRMEQSKTKHDKSNLQVYQGEKSL